MKKLPFYHDIICHKFRLNGRTYVIGLALPDGVDVRYPCYYLYVFDRCSPGSYKQLIGHPDVSYLFQYVCRNLLNNLLYDTKS